MNLKVTLESDVKPGKLMCILNEFNHFFAISRLISKGGNSYSLPVEYLFINSSLSSIINDNIPV